MEINRQQEDTLHTSLTTGESQKNKTPRMHRSRLSENKRNKVFTKCNGMCAYCGSQIMFDDFHIDHFIPFSLAGLLRDGRKLINSEDNLMPSCKTCNCKKNNLTSEEFRNKLFGGKSDESAVFYYHSIGVPTPDWLLGFSKSDIASFREAYRLETEFFKRLNTGKRRGFVTQHLHHGGADTYLVVFNTVTNEWEYSLIGIDPYSDDGRELIGKLTQNEKEGQKWFTETVIEKKINSR